MSRANLAVEFTFTLFPRLKERENQVGGTLPTLPGGEHQMLATARGLTSQPRTWAHERATARAA